MITRIQIERTSMSDLLLIEYAEDIVKACNVQKVADGDA